MRRRGAPKQEKSGWGVQSFRPSAGDGEVVSPGAIADQGGLCAPEPSSSGERILSTARGCQRRVLGAKESRVEASWLEDVLGGGSSPHSLRLVRPWIRL